MTVDLSDRLCLLSNQLNTFDSEVGRLKGALQPIEGVNESDRTDQAVGENGQREARQRRQELLSLEETRRQSVKVEVGDFVPTVAVNTHVTLRFTGSDQKKSFSIISFDGTLPSCIQGIMRSNTPVARAILGREVGEEVIASTPSGERKVLIMSIQALRPVP